MIDLPLEMVLIGLVLCLVLAVMGLIRSCSKLAHLKREKKVREAEGEFFPMEDHILDYSINLLSEMKKRGAINEINLIRIEAARRVRCRRIEARNRSQREASLEAEGVTNG